MDILRNFLVPWIEYIIQSYIHNPWGFVLSVIVLVSPMLAVLAYLSWVMRNNIKKQKRHKKGKRNINDHSHKNSPHSSKNK